MKLKNLFLLGFISSASCVLAQSSTQEIVSKSDVSFWNAGAVIAIVVAVIAIGISGWLFVEITKLKNVVDSLNTAGKSTSAKTKVTLVKLQEEIENIKRQVISRPSKPVETKKETVLPSEDFIPSRQKPVISRQASSVKPQDYVKETKETPTHSASTFVSKTIYFGAPKGKIFSNGKDNFVPGQSLYKLTETSPGRAEFVFSDRREALQVALRSISDYIESGCIIVQDSGSTPTRAITLKPGMAARSGNYWTIVSQAQIELS